MKAELFQTRKPNGNISEDAYFEFEEGLVLRPKVIAVLAIRYLKKHPELLETRAQQENSD